MKVGKLNWDELKDLIDSSRGKTRDDVRIKSGVGEDCCVINYGDHECALSTDPITGASENSGRLAVHINCNDVASTGVEPIGILVTILAPEYASMDDIKRVMKEIDEEARKLNIEVLGGHTEVTKAVNRMVISCTVVGKAKSGTAVPTSGAKVGDDIIITKDLCLEGACIIANDYEDILGGILTAGELEEAKSYMEQISVVPEGMIAGEFGVNSMHDITEGGVLGALWEVADASGKGFVVYKDRMPVAAVARKICGSFGIDPLKLISSGSMLITCSRGGELVKLLQDKGIKAATIGKIVDFGGYLVDGAERVEVLPPERDELFVLADKLNDIREV
ncbi:MAG: synthase [Firmicutes bacterium]|nr:synthase [Bacillota bacterium]